MTEETVWYVPAEEKREPGTIHVVVFALLIGVGAVAGAFGSLAIPLGYGVTGFWPGVAVQAVGGIWFGIWGVLAGALFPFISNSLAGAPLYVSLAYFPSNFIQGFLPALVFRYLKVDPRLRKTSDYIHFIWSAVLVNNFLGALWAVTVLQQFGLITVTSAPLFFSGWVIGNGVPALIFGIILLKVLSGFIIRHRSFVKRWVA
jgi:integral membrane sensor domain MASE1